MPAIIVAVVAAAAGAAATAAVTGAVVAGLTIGAFGASIVGAIVATGVGYGLSSVLGLNRAPKARTASITQTAEDRKQLIRSSVAPRQIIYGRSRVSGPIVYATSSGSDQQYLHLVIPLAAHEIDGIDGVFLNDEYIGADLIDGNGNVTTGPFGPRTVAATTFETETTTEAFARVRILNGAQGSADGFLLGETADGWGADHILYGVAYAYVRLRYDQEAFPNGLQGISFQVRGKRTVYDPRTGLSVFTANPALVILDYLRSSDGLGCSDDEIDFPSFVAAANICAELVQITAAGGTQSRYDCNGSFTLDRAPIDVMDEMLTSCAGTLVYVQGQYRLYVGAYDTPSDTLDVDDLAGPIEVVTKPPRRELFNGVRGTYIDPARSWQASEFAPFSEAAFVAEDGEAIWRDAEFPWTIDGTAAQRLAKMMLRRARESLTIRVPVQYKGVRFYPWQTLSVTLADFGWDAKTFRVMSWAFSPDSGVIILTLREETPQSYAWTYDDLGAVGTAPDTNLVDPFVIGAPSGLAMTEGLYVTREGTSVRARATLAWVRPGHPFVIGYEAQYRTAGVGDWRFASVTLGETTATIDDVAPGEYEWRVRAYSSVARGAWATLTARVSGLAAPPSTITGLAIQSIGGFAFLRWDLHPDADVRIGGRIEFRHSADGGATEWVASTSLGNSVPGNHTTIVMPLKPGVYFAKAIDSSGSYSASAAYVAASQATALAFANVDSLTEHTAFSGDKTGLVVTDDTLRLDTTGDIDAETDFDAIANIDNLGGVLAEGTYEFSAGIDVGVAQAVRATASLSAVIINTYDEVDARPALVDDWLDFDGAVGGEADAWVEVRTTQDDPAGTPTWDEWRRLDASEFSARGFEFRAQLRSSDPAFNIHVSELTASVDEVA